MSIVASITVEFAGAQSLEFGGMSAASIASAAASLAETAAGQLQNTAPPVTRSTRAGLVALLASPPLWLSTGTVLQAADSGLAWRYTGSGAVIADMPGTVPLGDVTPGHFGAVGDDTTDDTTAVAAALAASTRVVITRPHRVTAALRPQNSSRVELRGGASLRLTGAQGTLFNLAASADVVITGGRLLGNKAAAPNQPFIDLAGADRCTISATEMVDPSSGANGTFGAVSMQGSVDCEVSDTRITGASGNAVLIAGTVSRQATGNRVLRLRTTGAGLFSVLIRSGGVRNVVEGCDFPDSAIEPIGIQNGGEYNRILGNHCERSGDNGISISGDHNAVIGNVCRYNDRAGIHVWGAFNTITGNVCVGNDQEGAATVWGGIGTSANFGGTGQYNIISGNILDDDQAVPTQRNGIRFGGSVYPQWAPGVVISSNAIYRRNGLNVYVSTNAGTTGATPPTHTSGTVSDGGVSWRWQSAFVNNADADQNVATDNIIIRVAPGSSAVVDATASGNNSWSLPGDVRFHGSIRAETVSIDGSPAVAEASLTTGPLDATPGRVTKVGDYGIGSLTSSPLVTDIDSPSLPGGAILRVNDTTLGTLPPGAVASAAVHVLRLNSGIAIQVYRENGPALRSWSRRSDVNGVWGPWTQTGTLTLDSVLGTVSQSGGVPTGAIIERGSNANGEFVRFADGTLICTRSGAAIGAVTTADGALFSRTSINLSWASAYIAAPVVIPGQCSNPDVWITPVSSTTSIATVRPRSSVSTSDGGTFSLVGIGRWF